MSALDVTSPLVKSFLAGSLSGTCSTVLFQPLDLVKTRVQSEGGVGAGAVARRLVAEQNVAGLWRGLAPSLARTVPGVGLYFSSVHWIRTTLCESGVTAGPATAAAVGGSARVLAGAAMIPFTVIKTRFESPLYNYASVEGALRQILRQEGARSLAAGLGPTLLRDAPFSALYLCFYEQLKGAVPGEVVSHSPSAAHFSCGLVAGMLASLLTQPADVVKTRMQLEMERRSLAATVTTIYRQAGLAGFTAGLGPRMLRRTMMAALAWTVYERMIKSFGLK